MPTDLANHEYFEVETYHGEKIRATFLPATDAGYQQDSIRINIVDGSHVRQGPEIPLCFLDALIDGINGLRRLQ